MATALSFEWDKAYEFHGHYEQLCKIMSTACFCWRSSSETLSERVSGPGFDDGINLFLYIEQVYN